MNKQELIEKVNELSATQDMKDRLLSRLSLYPDSLEETHLNDFEEYVLEVIRDEELAAVLLEKAARHLQTGIDQADLQLQSDMEDIAAEAEATNNQAKQLAS